nr:hypothetical protein 5 [Spirochaetaceae bacterium]
MVVQQFPDPSLGDAFIGYFNTPNGIEDLDQYRDGLFDVCLDESGTDNFTKCHAEFHDLTIPHGTTYVLGPSTRTITVERMLMMNPNSGIIIMGDHWFKSIQIFAGETNISDTAFIESYGCRGQDGANGQDGNNSAAHNGQPGTDGMDGDHASNAADIHLSLGVLNLNQAGYVINDCGSPGDVPKKLFRVRSLGARGGHGGNGGDGGDGARAKCSPERRGKRGGDGGIAGNSGNGSDGGDITLAAAFDPRWMSLLDLKSKAGLAGTPGTGGRGGAGGPGKKCAWTYSLSGGDWGTNRPNGKPGRDGNPGSVNIVLVT